VGRTGVAHLGACAQVDSAAPCMPRMHAVLFFSQSAAQTAALISHRLHCSRTAISIMVELLPFC
jgi:hypothetical protein